MSSPQPIQKNGCVGWFMLFMACGTVYSVFESCNPKQENGLYSTWRCWKSLDKKWETINYGYPRTKPGGSDSECEPVK